MVRIWQSYADAERAVETIAKIMSVKGELPQDYAKAIKETIAVSYRGVVMHFYEVLAEKCPEALKYF